MIDRLRELKASQNPFEEEKVEAGTKQLYWEGSIALRNIFENEITLTRTIINQIVRARQRVAELDLAHVRSSDPVEEKAYTNELEIIVPAVNEKIIEAKQKINKLMGFMKENFEQTEQRALENAIRSLTRKLCDVVSKFQHEAVEFKLHIRNKARRQLEVLYPDISTLEMEEVLRSKRAPSDLYREAIMKGEASVPLQNVAADVKNKYEAILDLETAMVEINQMMIDLALLTEQQGEMLDQIEFHVNEASEFIDRANEDLEKSTEYQRQICIRWIVIITVVLVIIGIVLGVVLGTKVKS